MLLRTLPLVIVAAAVVVYFAGAEAVGFVLLIAGCGAMIVLNRLRDQPTPPPDLAPDQQEALRAEKERGGEVAAVRLLRKEHPGVSLLDAVRLVRTL